MEPVGTGTRYVFTALHRNDADFETNKESGFYQGTEIAVDRFVEHVRAMKEYGRRSAPVFVRVALTRQTPEVVMTCDENDDLRSCGSVAQMTTVGLGASPQRESLRCIRRKPLEPRVAEQRAVVRIDPQIAR